MNDLARERHDEDPRALIDPRLNTAGREGLTGTAPQEVYARPEPAEQLTIAPDWRPMEQQPAWRRDFPVDWPQDVYVERRDFMKFLVLTSLAFTAGQFWIGVENWWRRRRGRPAVARVVAVDEIPVGGATTFGYPRAEDACVLIRTGDAAFVAYGQKCTHLSCAVRPRLDEGVLHCPCHEGVFDLASGRPIAGPPRRPLPRVRLEIRGPDLYATGVDERSA